MKYKSPFDNMSLYDIMKLSDKGYNFIIHDGCIIYIKISKEK